MAMYDPIFMLYFISIVSDLLRFVSLQCVPTLGLAMTLYDLYLCYIFYCFRHVVVCFTSVRPDPWACHDAV